jgi:hypothetical protein
MTVRSHQRSTAAVVLTRSDAPGPAPTGDAAQQGGAADTRPSRIWPLVLVWLLLGGAVAALWALLLFGDSLAPSG